MAIHVWAMLLDQAVSEEEIDALTRILPEPRRERLRQADKGKQEEPLCAYWLLKEALQEYRGWSALPGIACTATGKPYFPEYPGTYFNISHTDRAVLVAVGDVPLGVDIEKERRISPRMIERFPCGEAAENFFAGWVRWEAHAKYTGKGIAEFLHGAPILQEGEQYRALSLFSGYRAGICFGGEAQAISIRILLRSENMTYCNYTILRK